MTYAVSLIIMTLLTTTSSFAASAILPPLPNQLPPPTLQEAAKPPPAVITEPAPPPVTPQAPKQDTIAPSSSASQPQTPQVITNSPPVAESKSATEQTMPAADMKKPDSDTQDNPAEEHDSFMDTGQQKLPRIGQQGDGSSSGSYNASDLRIPVIESEEKEAAQNSQQPEAQVSTNAPPADLKPTTPDAATSAAADPAAPSAALPAVAEPVTTTAAPDQATSTHDPSVQSPASSTAIQVALPEAHPDSPSTPVQAALPETHPTPADPAITVVEAPTTSQEATTPTAPAVASSPSAVAPPLSAKVKADVAVIPVATSPSTPSSPVVVSPPKPEAIGVARKHKDKKRYESEHTTAHTTAPLTPDHIKFIDDEAVVFTLADDDTELGKLTEAAKIRQMPGGAYIKLFWKNYENQRNEIRRRDVDLFLAMYEAHPSEAYEGAMNYDEASNQAFDAASSGKLSDLRAIITYYPVLQMRDARGDNMLSSAIESDNIEIARFLLIRGIDLYSTNYEGYDAFSIAREENNEDASALLNKAKFLVRR